MHLLLFQLLDKGSVGIAPSQLPWEPVTTHLEVPVSSKVT